MIVLDLICARNHRFEGWFASSEDFEKQQETTLLVCPMCGAHDVCKLPSAPHIQRAADTRSNAVVEARAALAEPEHAQILSQLLDKLRENAAQSEDVGKDFPAEVRRIHQGDAEERAIKGLASISELESLLEEGISVLPVPPAKEDLH